MLAGAEPKPHRRRNESACGVLRGLRWSISDTRMRTRQGPVTCKSASPLLFAAWNVMLWSDGSVVDVHIVDQVGADLRPNTATGPKQCLQVPARGSMIMSNSLLSNSAAQQ
jgi:hypothetical protein